MYDRKSAVVGSLLLLMMLVISFTGVTCAAWDRGPAEYCHREIFNATCDADSVVVMQSARYGRMSLGKCIRIDLGYLGCAVDVLSVLDATCSGRPSCTLNVDDDVLYRTHPCPADITPHLEASYTCLKVATDADAECRSRGAIRRTERVGLLASHVTETQGWGGSACPWELRVPPGQRINITLFNFARGAGGSDLLTADPSVCYELASIHEQGHQPKNILTCGTDSREKNVYISETNKVEVRFVDRTLLRNLGKFVLQHQAVGCPDIKPPAGAWVKSDGLTASIRCNQSEETWFLTCRGDKWDGKFNNCSSGSFLGGGLFSSKDAFPYSILIVVAIGVALGVFVGGLLLSLAIYYLKRKQAKKEALEAARTMGPDPKDFVDERTLQWANYPSSPAAGPGSYPPYPPHSDSIPYDPRDPDKDFYAHGRMNPNDYGGPRHHIYESPNFT